MLGTLSFVQETDVKIMKEQLSKLDQQPEEVCLGNGWASQICWSTEKGQGYWDKM